jgi:hypothetical protein
MARLSFGTISCHGVDEWIFDRACPWSLGFTEEVVEPLAICGLQDEFRLTTAR